MPEAAAQATNAVVEAAARIAHGYMPPERFLAFLDGVEQSSLLPASFWLLPFALLLAGLAMNLTPCVLPMVPVNLIVVGKSWRRGLLYGLGMALAYGALGVAAAVGGLAFGAIQGNPWFNAAVAAVFAVLSLALFGAFSIDFSRYRPARQGNDEARRASPLFPLLMGALSAVLAGACVAPVLVSALLLTADLYAGGNVLALGLPFLIGVGMALPWPFLGAGLKVLPKPGAWMKSVNRVFAAVVLAFAAWYGVLAFRGFAGDDAAPGDLDGAVDATPATVAARLAEAKRPVLVDCWATWCKNCAAMERGTLADPAVRKALERFTVIRLQAEDIGELVRQPGFGGVSGLPAYLVFE